MELDMARKLSEVRNCIEAHLTGLKVRHTMFTHMVQVNRDDIANFPGEGPALMREIYAAAGVTRADYLMTWSHAGDTYTNLMIHKLR